MHQCYEFSSNPALDPEVVKGREIVSNLHAFPEQFQNVIIPILDSNLAQEIYSMRSVNYLGRMYQI